ncbi:MAG: insulinase family protein [Clostridiales bacterium]|nr:insulinase family protein [Clostridiales bacterium]
MNKINLDIKKHKLSNGLEVISIKKESQIASINVGVRVGAIYENIDEKGISHFIEHMLFKGTEKRDNKKLNKDLEALGGEYNAYTDYNETVYTISCLSEELKKAVVLLGDMMTSSIFSESEIERERGVILSEIRSNKDDIEDLSFKKTNEVAFEKSPLKYDVTGLEKGVSKFRREEIYKYYKKYYTPDNIIVTVVSPFEHSEILEMVEGEFQKENWNSNKSINRSPKVIMEKNKNITKVSYKNDIEQSSIIYLYTFYDLEKKDELPLKILNHRLGESANSLLFREIREEKGLAYDVYTHLDMTKNVKSLYIYTAVSNEDVNKTIKAIDEIIKKVVNGEIIFGEEDLEIMKKVHKTAVISTLEDSAELCNYVLHQELDNEEIFEFVKDMEKLNKLNIEQIINVARKVLKEPTIHVLTKRKE